MSDAYIPEKTKIALWARAAGRCQFTGCNKLLLGDLIASKRQGKFGFIAHIVGDKVKGPRGDEVRSPLLKADIENLMLMCPEHHKGIDVDYLDDYPEGRLLEMKRQHEERIAIVTDMDVDRAAHVVRFAANIGMMDSLVSTKAIFAAMPPDRHPADFRTIDIELAGSDLKDNEPEYWQQQRENLLRMFARKVKERVGSSPRACAGSSWRRSSVVLPVSGWCEQPDPTGNPSMTTDQLHHVRGHDP